jgi:glutamate transport system permease protein
MSEQTVLFDAPGPRAVRRYRIIAGVGGVLSLAVVAWVLVKLGEKGNLSAAKWSPFLHPETWTEYLIPGLIGTLKAAVISVVLASVLGLLLGIGRLSEIAPIRWVSSVVVEFFRAVPVLLMMLFTFALYSTNNLFPASQLSLAAVVTGLTLYNGAVIAELVRAGVGGLPSGQREAGLSVGLTDSQTLRGILLPQALTAMLPALVGQLVVVLKDSALGYVITYEELLNKANQVGTSAQNVVPAFLVVAVLFIVINYGLSRLAGLLERRLNRRGRTSGHVPGAPGQEPIVDPMRTNTETG